MPVEDHPVHPHGVRGAEHKASCHDRQAFAEGYWAPNGWYADSGCTLTLGRTWVEHTMSRKCRQLLDLPECAGCTAEKDEEYITKMRNL